MLLMTHTHIHTQRKEDEKHFISTSFNLLPQRRAQSVATYLGILRDLFLSILAASVYSDIQKFLQLEDVT